MVVIDPISIRLATVKGPHGRDSIVGKCALLASREIRGSTPCSSTINCPATELAESIIEMLFAILGCLRAVQFLNPKIMAFKLPPERPKNGNLIRVYPSGKVATLAANKPFVELQLLKKKYRMTGIPESQLKVTNLKPDQK